MRTLIDIDHALAALTAEKAALAERSATVSRWRALAARDRQAVETLRQKILLTREAARSAWARASGFAGDHHGPWGQCGALVAESLALDAAADAMESRLLGEIEGIARASEQRADDFERAGGLAAVPAAPAPVAAPKVEPAAEDAGDFMPKTASQRRAGRGVAVS